MKELDMIGNLVGVVILFGQALGIAAFLAVSGLAIWWLWFS